MRARRYLDPPDDTCPQCRERLALYVDEQGDVCCLYCVWWVPSERRKS